MSVGAPNKFYAPGHADFDHGNYKRRAPGHLRDNSAYSDSPRLFHYRMIRPGRGRVETGLVSPSPSIDSAGYFENNRSYKRTPHFETERTYEHYYPDEAEEYQPSNPMVLTSEYSEGEEDPRSNQKRYPYTEFTYERPYDYYTNAPKSIQRHCSVPRKRYYSYHEEPPQDDYNREYRKYLPRDLGLRTNRPYRDYDYSQASGSMPPEFSSNYYTQRNANDYDEKNSEYYEDYSDENSQNQHEEIHRYFDPDYNKESRKTPPPIPFPKPEPKHYKVRSSSYKDITDPSNYPTKDKKTVRDYKLKDRNVPPYEEPKDSQKKYNRYKRHYQPEKMPTRKSCNHFKETREAPKKYDRISKDILRLAPPKKYEKHRNTQDDRFYVDKRSHRNSEYRYKIQNKVHQAIPSSYKKYFSDEVPLSNYHKKVSDDIPRTHENLRSEPPRSSREYESHKNKRRCKSLPDPKKSVDFVRFTDLNDGSEIPHKIHESNQTPSSIFFTIEIPYKKKERRYAYSQKSEYIPKRSDSGCETFASNLNCALNSFKPQTSFYDVRKDRRRKTIKQKISGFFKRSKMCLTKSNIFRNKSNVLRNYKPGLRRLSYAHIDCRNNESPSPHYISNSPKTSSHSLEVQNKRVPIRSPSIENASEKYCTRLLQGCHYPTVYRANGNQQAENDDKMYHEYSMYNILSSSNHRSKVNKDEYEHCDKGLTKRNSQYFRTNADLRMKNSNQLYNRVSSGNCSLFSGDKCEDPIETSQISICLEIRATDVSLTGSPRIISSKVVTGHGLSTKSNTHMSREDLKVIVPKPPNLLVSRQNSGSSIRVSNSSATQDNQFNNVRFSPPAAVHNSGSSTTNSSKGSSSRTERSEDFTNRKSIEEFSKPPTVISGRPSENLRPRHPISTKWSLTRQSKSCNSQKEFCNSWTPDRLENNFSRPTRPGLFQTNTIEMCSRPPTLIQSDINKRSSLKGVNNNFERSAPKKVILKTNSYNSLISGSGRSTQSDCSCEKSGMQNTHQSECHRSQSHNFQFDEKRKIEVSPRKTNSWPSQRPKTIPQVPIQTSFSKPLQIQESALKVQCKSSESSLSKCSSGSRNFTQGPKNMQLVSYSDSIPGSSCEPQSEYASNFTAMPSQDVTETSVRGNLSCPKLTDSWDKDSYCRRSIVEELKRELLQSFRADRQMESQVPFLRPTPHIMIFPCVPEAMCQSNPNLNPNLFRRPESVVCWTPGPKSQNPFC